MESISKSPSGTCSLAMIGSSTTCTSNKASCSSIGTSSNRISTAMSTCSLLEVGAPAGASDQDFK